MNEKRKTKKAGCLISVVVFVLFLGGLAFGVTQMIKNPEKYGAVANDPQTILDFDTRTWGDFKNLYISHNNFIKSIDKYGSGLVTELDFYEKCVEAKNYFQRASMTFGYGKNQDERDYLSAFSNMSLSDQMAAQDFLNYIDNKRTSDLSSARANIQAAKDAMSLIASNRGLLLAKTDLTDDEIKQRVEAGMEGLE